MGWEDEGGESMESVVDYDCRDPDEHELGLLRSNSDADGARSDRVKFVAFVVIGLLTLVYCIIEIVVALYMDSLTLLSDGFHNFSDVIAIVIAYYAAEKAKSPKTSDMSFGWVRTELLGGLINGSFLLSLSLYIVLEAIPRFIPSIARESAPSENGSGLWYIGVAALGVAINTIGSVVFFVTGQAHSHSHGDGGHAHHGHGGDGGHSHGRGGHSHANGGGHGHSIHGAINGSSDLEEEIMEVRASPESGIMGMDANVYAVFIHYVGDMLSSLVVLGVGLLMKFFDGSWTMYLDPFFSLVIVGIILYTTIPFVHSCGMVLLQSSPRHVNMDELSVVALKVRGVKNIHDLHVWQLVDNVCIGTIHVVVDPGADLPAIFDEMKAVFHSFGIHSTVIQPEFRSIVNMKECEENCVPSCNENWCCKSSAEIPTYGNSL